MTSSIKVICGVCESQHRTTNADFWCPECDEGLCSQCLKYHNALKATRLHEVIPVENYKQLPTSIANISHHCSEHDRTFQNYCPQHESICCPLCIHSNHANCVGILSLEKVIQTAKTSVLLESFDQDLQNIKMNIERVVQDRKQNLFEIQKQKQKFHDEIKQVRYKVNEHLDTLEQQILQDLYAAEKKVKSEIEDLLGKLAKNTEKVNAMENNVSAIKDYASDLQTFLGSKMIETEIQKYETFLQSLFDDGSLQKIDINCKIEDKITDVLSTVTSLGVISIELSSPIVVMETGKEIQAQTMYLQIDKPPARDDREGWRRRGTPSKDERPPPASDDRGPPPGRDKRVPPGDAWRNRRDDRGPPPSGESAWGRDRGRGDRGPPGDAWGRDRNRDDRVPPAESWRDKSRDTGAPPGASWGDRATARDSKRARPRKFDRGPSRGSRFASRDMREERGSPSRDYREDRGPSRDDKEEIDPWRRGGDSDRFGGGSDSLRDDRWESRKGGGGTPSEGGPPKTSWKDKQPENENEETW
ncbi:eukaryotic translation initiation factor 3 subunit A-like [Mytilus edulis]|uniref:eukaryotic translation initiation factor 3 subunit A-like n=1 Tax=Mytilus edulis TaxID=6550 RepID=UPI0039EDEB7A